MSDSTRPLHETIRHRGIITIAVMLAMIMQILDTTIANVALPHMQTALGATFDTVTWVLTSYIVASAIAIPITGWLADQVGVRRLFLWSVGGFVATSMACGAATSLPEMVLFRFLQGVCAAFIGPLSQAIMLNINPPERHARAMSVWGMGIMIGPILGPVLGGWIVEDSNWRWIFYINMPVGLVTYALLFALLPRDKPMTRKFDLFGFAMLAIGLAALQLMLDRGNHLGWLESTEVLLELSAAVVFLWMFAVHMATAKNPLFERAMLVDRNLVTAIGFMALVGIIMFSCLALLPPMLQNLYGYPVIDTGAILSSRGVGVLLTMGLSGRLLAKFDARLIVGCGLLIAACSLYMMSRWSLDTHWLPISFSGFVQGLGMGLVFIPLNTIAFTTLAVRYRTSAASLLNLSRSIGASIGISIAMTLLANNTQISHSDLASNITDSSISFFDPGSMDRYGPIGEAALRLLDLEINRQAAMIAYINDYWIMMWLTLLAVPLLITLKPVRPGSRA